MRRSNHTDAEIIALLQEAADGVPIEDNVGSLENPIPPGQTGTVALTSDGCEIIHVAVGMADDRELVGMYDICTDRLVVVTDK